MMIPITRKEKYINEIVGGGNTAPETPQTREELFYAAILGEVVAPLPVTRVEKYLSAIAGQYSGELPEPVTRIERFIARAAGMDVTIPTPITREEMFWADYALIVEKELSGIPPLTFKAKKAGTLKNYRIYGNTVNGESVGDRTGNLFDSNINVISGYLSDEGILKPATETGQITFDYIPIISGTYTFTYTVPSAYDLWFGVCTYDESRTFQSRLVSEYSGAATFTIPDTTKYIRISLRGYNKTPIIMLNEGSTALPYEPFGYKVPVTVSNDTDTLTTPIYLPEQIRKVGDEAEYIDYAEQKQHRVRKNLLQNTATSQTINGVTFTVNSDGSIVCDGQASPRTAVLIFSEFLVPSGAYILTGCPNGGSEIRTYKMLLFINGAWLANDIGSGANFTLTETSTVSVRIDIYNGYTCDNLTFYPMIRKADIEDDTYEPYIENTDVDVILPGIAVTAGTNTLTVGTEVQPSKVYLKGKIEEIPTRTVSYYSQDGSTLLGTETVESGGNASGLQDTPTKPDTEQYTYTFVGWSNTTNATTAMSGILNNITADKSVYAAFSETARTYTVYFYNGETLLETVTGVPSGGTATYTGTTPTKSGYIFDGWNPSNTNITADTSCYAQFKEDEMYESITDTWSEIIANVSNGTYSTKYHIGDTKKIDLGTEGEVIMTIVGIDTDDLADNSGKAPITWISKQLLKTSHRMNPSYSSGTEGTGSLGGWEKTEMRSYLKETVKPLIPEVVRNAIKPVKKYSRIYNASGSAVNDVLTTEDVWIPSYKEVFGSGLETQGPTYSTAFPDNASRIKSEAGSSAAWWWLRSADGGNGFDIVNSDGSNTRDRARNTGGVVLGFCT